jgi:hypothetical protein
MLCAWHSQLWAAAVKVAVVWAPSTCVLCVQATWNLHNTMLMVTQHSQLCYPPPLPPSPAPPPQGATKSIQGSSADVSGGTFRGTSASEGVRGVPSAESEVSVGGPQGRGLLLISMMGF